MSNNKNINNQTYYGDFNKKLVPTNYRTFSAIPIVREKGLSLASGLNCSHTDMSLPNTNKKRILHPRCMERTNKDIKVKYKITIDDKRIRCRTESPITKREINVQCICQIVDCFCNSSSKGRIETKSKEKAVKHNDPYKIGVLTQERVRNIHNFIANNGSQKNQPLMKNPSIKSILNGKDNDQPLAILKEVIRFIL